MKCRLCGEEAIIKTKIVRGAAVKFNENGEAVIVKETDTFAILEGAEVTCAKCKQVLPNGMKDIVDTVKCDCCGEDFDSNKLINGKCPTCLMNEVNPELATMSKEDLLLELLKLQSKKVDIAATKNEDKVEKAKAQKPATKKAEPVEEKEDQDDIDNMEENAPKAEPKAKAKGKAKPKAKEEDDEEEEVPTEKKKKSDKKELKAPTLEDEDDEQF